MKRAIGITVGAVVLAVAVSGSAQAKLIGFSSPSGNIGCVGSNDPGALNSVRCDIVRRSWEPPPRPARCTLDWGQGVELGRRGGAHWVCAGDTALGATRVLGYGTSIRIGRLRCTSRRIGMSCRNAHGYGFRISRQRMVHLRPGR